MTPIERAARVLCENPSEDPDELIMMMNGQMWPRWRAEVWRVEAVLTAIREPSEGMMRAVGESEVGAIEGVAAIVWRSMIDAALAEQ